MAQSALFLSIDGMTDPLGQSQVIPYLQGLAAAGYKMHVVSCEKSAHFERNHQAVKEQLDKYGIGWSYFFYTRKIPLASQRKNFRELKRLAEQELLVHKARIIHCRSYLPALIGLRLKKKYGIRFIFDMRGFWADERLDGNIWSLGNPLHRYLYHYFKQKEKEMLQNADQVVVLTEEAKRMITSEGAVKAPVDVIPCCADTRHFRLLSEEEKAQARRDLNISPQAPVMGYLGSLGTWYMLPEMLDLFATYLRREPGAILFFVTNDAEDTIRAEAEARGIPSHAILVRAATRKQVPVFISCFNYGLFFIKPLFSKKGSSPTKLAEILSCGVPIITNTGVGDVDQMVRETGCGVLVEQFTSEGYLAAIDALDKLNKDPAHYRAVSLSHFSLDKGVAAYQQIYHRLSKA